MNFEFAVFVDNGYSVVFAWDRVTAGGEYRLSRIIDYDFGVLKFYRVFRFLV